MPPSVKGLLNLMKLGDKIKFVKGINTKRKINTQCFEKVGSPPETIFLKWTKISPF